MAPDFTEGEQALVDELHRLRAHGRTVIAHAAATRAASRDICACVAPAEKENQAWRSWDEAMEQWSMTSAR